ncbi:Nucleoid-associated protein [Tenacibaculum sp. 190524A02b]|uniref:nucleoid-associated protein n=1 Tax=Tenacibaculum vairaonense TaxID=3137860 RepID=UPI0032B1BD34
MISFAEAVIEDLYIHEVGNKFRNDGVIIHDNGVNIENNDNLKYALNTYFFSSFQGNESLYQFYHEVDIYMNEVFVYVSNIFDNHSKMRQESINISKHLYNSSLYPNIKTGELCVVLVKNISYKKEYYDGIGLFKSENKDTFLKIKKEPQGINILDEKGIDIKKIDKGCIILNKNKKNGYVISSIGTTNKKEEAKYWINEFLNLTSLKNEFHQTNKFLGLTKKFITEQLVQDFEVNKTDQIDFLNRSVTYFKKHEEYKKDEFEEIVFEDDSIIESFRDFNNKQDNCENDKLPEKFKISENAVKKQARAFKSILKLDKNFHVYIHGDKSKIEKGVETDGRKYYKIYYENER